MEEKKEEVEEKKEEGEEAIPEKTGKNLEGRDEYGRMLPGFTCNPKGRPKGTLSLLPLLKQALGEKLVYADGRESHSYAKALIKKILKKAIIDEDVQMIKYIFDRIDGLPRQKIDFNDESLPEENRLLDVIELLDDETQNKLISAINKQRVEGSDIQEEPANND